MSGPGKATTATATQLPHEEGAGQLPLHKTVAAPATHGRLAHHPTDIPASAGGRLRAAHGLKSVKTACWRWPPRRLLWPAGAVSAVTAFVSLYGLCLTAPTVFQHLALVDDILPPAPSKSMRDQMTRIVDAKDSGLGIAFIISLVTAIWSANAGVKAIFDALNVAYKEREKRSIVTLNLISLATTAAMLVAHWQPSA